MDEFPSDFTAKAISKKSSEISTDDKYQKQILQNLRAKIVKEVNEAVEFGKLEYIVKVPNMLNDNSVLILAQELLERFPGQIQFLYSFYHGLAEHFAYMQTAQISKRYKIILD